MYPREMKTYAYTKTCKCVFTAALFIRAPNWKQCKCLSTSGPIKKMWYTPCNGILLTIDKFYHMTKSWKYYAMWKTANWNDHLLYESMYMKCPEKAKLWRQMLISICQRPGRVSKGWIQMYTSDLLKVWGYSKMEFDEFCTTSKMTKNHQIVHL